MTSLTGNSVFCSPRSQCSPQLRLGEQYNKGLGETKNNVSRGSSYMSTDSRALLSRGARGLMFRSTNLSLVKGTKEEMLSNMKSSHVRISYRFYRFVTTDFYIVKLIVPFLNYTHLKL